MEDTERLRGVASRWSPSTMDFFETIVPIVRVDREEVIAQKHKMVSSPAIVTGAGLKIDTKIVTFNFPVQALRIVLRFAHLHREQHITRGIKS